MPEKRSNYIGSRIPPEKRRAVDDILRDRGWTDSKIINELLDAFIIAERQQPQGRFPLEVTLAERSGTPIAHVAEEPDVFGSSKSAPPKGGAGPPIGERHSGAGPDAAVS